MFTSAMGGSGGVQYHDASPEVTIYRSGSKAWRTHNRGLIPADLLAWQHGAIGRAEGVAVFGDVGTGIQALHASVREYVGRGSPTVEGVLQHYVPDYVPAPPPPPTSPTAAGEEEPERIEPHTDLPAEDPARGHETLLADTIVDLIEYTPGRVIRRTLEELAAAGPAGSNVLINGRTAVHAGSEGRLNTIDICKTPRGDSCVPVAYNNRAVSMDADRTASTVFINGEPACHAKSTFGRSTGDEPGRCGGGVRSGTITQKAEFVTHSANVFIEGQPAVRQFDLMVANSRNTAPMPLMQPGGKRPPDIDLLEEEEARQSQLPDETDWDIPGADADLLHERLGHPGE